MVFVDENDEHLFLLQTSKVFQGSRFQIWKSALLVTESMATADDGYPKTSRSGEENLFEQQL